MHSNQKASTNNPFEFNTNGLPNPWLCVIMMGTLCFIMNIPGWNMVVFLGTHGYREIGGVLAIFVVALTTISMVTSFWCMRLFNEVIELRTKMAALETKLDAKS